MKKKFTLTREYSYMYGRHHWYLRDKNGSGLGSFCPSIVRVLRNKSQKRKKVSEYDVSVSFKNNGGVGIKLWVNKYGELRIARLSSKKSVISLFNWEAERGLKDTFGLNSKKSVVIYVRLKAVGKKKRKAARAA